MRAPLVGSSGGLRRMPRNVRPLTEMARVHPRRR
ncbi:hypothetical protein BJ970_003034 [Saccharopolyspora phatthalungensis]|uniref:Uncharacterized protein n=1 Tax=Saccharopolyspora phatthalungensis TaxID=664693 RepID=A0A840Q6I5_9PSEU|nr:hypothetical protein [Saccharopolyspora phatthalungensis]